MAARRPTQTDVANRAGVSRGTVSLVLNGRDDGKIAISDSTRQRVIKAAQDLGYAPNPVAQMLAHGSNDLLGVFVYEAIFPYKQDDFFFPYLSGLEREASTQGYNVLLFTRNRNGTTPQIYQNGMNSLRLADGSILLGSHPVRDELRQLTEENYPFVYIGRREIEGIGGINWVANDYQSGSYDAVKHLLDLGHTHIGFIGRGMELEPQQDKFAGCERAIAEYGLGTMHILPETLCTDNGETLRHLIASGEITALLCPDDKTFIQTMNLLHVLNLRAPDHLSVISLTTARYFAPWNIHPTHVELNRYHLGQQAARILIDTIRGVSEAPRQIIVPCKFVPGETTGPPPGYH